MLGRMRLFAALLPPDRVTAELLAVRDELRLQPGADRLRWTERANWHITLAFYGEVTERRYGELCERLARAAARSRPLALCVAGGGRFGDRALWAGIAEAARTESGAAVDADGAADGGDPGDAGDAGDAGGAAGSDGRGPVDAVEALRRLAGAANAAGRRSGLDVDRKFRFHAHLTLAHSRAIRRSRRDRPAPGDPADPSPSPDAGPDAGPDVDAVDLRPYVTALDHFLGEPWTAGELALVRSHLPTSGVPGEQPRYERLEAWPLGR